MADGDDTSASFSNPSWMTNDESVVPDPGGDGSGSDSFTVTETKSWFQCLSSAIIAVILGLLLVIGAGALLFWNESRAVTTARSLTEGAGVVAEVDSTRIDPANEGRLVHVSGELQPSKPLVDPTFGVTANDAVRLVRTVEMYQWKEDSRTETHKKLGGGEESVTTYTYTRTWSDHPVQSSQFRQPNGHQNPAMRYAHFEAVAADATLGAFRPGEAALRRLSAGT